MCSYVKDIVQPVHIFPGQFVEEGSTSFHGRGRVFLQMASSRAPSDDMTDPSPKEIAPHYTFPFPTHWADSVPPSFVNGRLFDKNRERTRDNSNRTKLPQNAVITLQRPHPTPSDKRPACASTRADHKRLRRPPPATSRTPCADSPPRRKLALCL